MSPSAGFQSMDGVPVMAGGVETWDNDDVVRWAQRIGCNIDPSDAFEYVSTLDSN